MIWYRDDELMVRNMEEGDAQVFFDEFTAQGWHPDIEYYRMRMREQAEGKCVALTAEYKGQPAGAVYVYLTVREGPFKGKGWPMIVDFSVLEKYQRKGIGTSLLKAVLERYPEVRQIELATDNTPETAAFYRSLGFCEFSELGCRGFMKC